MGGRALDLLLKMVAQSSHTMYRCRTLPLPMFKRCYGCGRFVREKAPLQFQRSMTSQVAAFQQELPPMEHPRDIAATIIKLSKKRRTKDALQKYLKALSHNQIPSKESLYQLAFALYRQKNLNGLYALHDTLLVQYKKTPMSRRTRRSLVYLYTMIIRLITNNVQKKSDLDVISHLCREMAEINLANQTSLYNTLLHLFLKRRDWSSCHTLFDNMKQRHIHPTVHTYTTILKVHAWQRDLDSMSKLLDDMYSRRISPDTGIVSVIVFGLCRQRQFDLARSFVTKVFEISGGDPRLLGSKTRKKLQENIDLAEKERRKLVRVRASWRKSTKKQQRKNARGIRA